MKTILVLTDFSKNATHAAAEALTLGGKLRADLLLFNTYINYPITASYAVEAWIAEEFAARVTHSKLGLETLAEGLEALTDELDEGDRIPSIYWQSEDYDLAFNINEICRHKNIELIVMGTRADNKGDFLYGEDTDSVIDRARRPVLIVPEKSSLKQVRKIVFATDFDASDIDVIHHIMKFGNAFHCLIEVVHITAPGEEDASNDRRLAFTEAFAKLKYQGMSYRELSGNEITARLKHICNEDGPGILAIMHRQHSFFAGLFKHSKTKELLVNQKLPLLVFPSGMK
jgi:nucleotide-binding universal stress UspA family protein